MTLEGFFTTEPGTLLATVRSHADHAASNSKASAKRAFGEVLAMVAKTQTVA